MGYRSESAGVGIINFKTAWINGIVGTAAAAAAFLDGSVKPRRPVIE